MCVGLSYSLGVTLLFLDSSSYSALERASAFSDASLILSSMSLNSFFSARFCCWDSSKLPCSCIVVNFLSVGFAIPSLRVDIVPAATTLLVEPEPLTPTAPAAESAKSTGSLMVGKFGNGWELRLAGEGFVLCFYT